MLAAGAVLPLLPGHPGVSCPLRRLTGIPCPLCGMSTSVEQTVRLHLHAALVANPAGIVAVLAALFLLVVRPRRLRFPPLRFNRSHGDVAVRAASVLHHLT